MRPQLLMSLIAAAAGLAGPPQSAAQGVVAGTTRWELRGIRNAFCVELLLDPAADVLRDLPGGYRAIAARQAAELHAALKSVVDGQPEFAAWSPSRLCFTAMDTIRTEQFQLADRSGKHPRLFALWTVAADSAGARRDVALGAYANDDRLIRSARLAGLQMRDARLSVGKVPAEDSEGRPSAEDRFQVKLGKTTVTWDGHLAGDTVRVAHPLTRPWTAPGQRGGDMHGELTWSPAYAHSMVGSLKVDGKDPLARALRSSPTRFAGPAYGGGVATVVFGH